MRRVKSEFMLVVARDNRVNLHLYCSFLGIKMPYRCYQCQLKFLDGNECLKHAIGEHPDASLAMYRPQDGGSGYVATHYGIVPRDRNMQPSDVDYNENNKTVTFSVRTGISTPASKATRYSATPVKYDEEFDETHAYGDNEKLVHCT